MRLAGIFLFMTAILLSTVQAKAEQTVTVFVNESKVVRLKEQFSEYALGNDAVADCVVRRNDEYGAEVVLNGAAEGTTNLIFWDQGGQIFAKFNVKVQVRDLGQAAANVKERLEGIQGIKVEVAGQKIIVSGKVLTTDDLKRVNLLLEGDDQVINTVTLGPAALKVMARIIDDFAGGEGQVEVRTIGQNLVLIGTVYGKGSAGRIEDFAKVFHADVVNLIKEKEIDLDVGAGKMVQVFAHFMEVNTDAMEALGFSWSPLGSLETRTDVGETSENGVHNHNAFWQVNGFLSELLPHFENGRERNMGRQLKVSSVSVKSGQPAEFQSGGELGYPVVSTMGATSLEFKKYGITLKVLPFAQGNNVTLKIHVKINIPTNLGSAGAGSVGSYVNFTNTEVDTTQYCRTGDSIAISGLLSQIDRKAFDADPGSSGALFELFRSKEFHQEKSDLVIFITPEILADARDANLEMKQRAIQLFDSYDPVSR